MVLHLCIFHHSWLEHISQLFSLTTPIILFVWFCYTQYQRYLASYCKEIEGVYAGFVSSSRNLPDIKGLKSGIIMNIRDVDNKGFFKGDIDYGEVKLSFQNMIPVNKPMSAGTHTFLGKLNYQFYRDKIRHPLKPEENRIYKGKLYIITRFDFPFEIIKMEEYLHAVYDITHYREMKVLTFNLDKSIKEMGQKLPESFTLYKSAGYPFEPLKGVTDIVFNELSGK